MKKETLIEGINELLLPLGFKKKGNNWTFDSGELIKVVNLQKSSFGNIFYINYGYILHSIPLEKERMHFFEGLGSKEQSINNSIKEILNLDTDLPSNERSERFKKIIKEIIIREFGKINSESDLYQYLKESGKLNLASKKIKEYFKLS